jgi:hypothetical protein
MSASGKFAKLPHFLQFVPTHFRTPSYRALKTIGLVYPGRRFACPGLSSFRLAAL